MCNRSEVIENVIENEKDNINVFCTKLKIYVSHTFK